MQVQLKSGWLLWCLLSLVTPAKAGDCGDYRDVCCFAPVICAPQCGPALRTVQLPQYQQWGSYAEWFPLNVRDVYRGLAQAKRAP